MSYSITDSITIENKTGVISALKELVQSVDGNTNWYFDYNCDITLMDLLLQDIKTIELTVSTRYGLATKEVDKLFETTKAFGSHSSSVNSDCGDPCCSSDTTVYKEGKPYQHYITRYDIFEDRDMWEIRPIETEIIAVEERYINNGRHWSYKSNTDNSLPF